MKLTRRKFLGMGAGAGAVAALGVRIPVAGSAPLTRPNILVIALDDMSSDELGALAYLNSRPEGSWMTFPNFIIHNPLCGPSRATTLTGMASHKHGVLFNGDCWRLNDSDLLPVWLQQTLPPPSQPQALYRTGLIGKYLNQYPFVNRPDSATYIPPGWNGWAAYVAGQAYQSSTMNQGYVNFTLRSRRLVNGAYEPVDMFYKGVGLPGQPNVPCPGPPVGCAPCMPPPTTQPGCTPREDHYSADVFTERAIDFLDSTSTKPFFLTVCYNAPHKTSSTPEDLPAQPAARHENAFSNLAPLRWPNVPNYDRVDGKPKFIRDLPPLQGTQAQTHLDYERLQAWRSLVAVDEGIHAIIDHLKAQGRLANTIVFVTSDNGYCHGQFRWKSKLVPYEPSCRTTMMVRHPAVPSSGVVNPLLVGNIDFAWTISDFAGLTGRKPGYPAQNGAQSFAGAIDPSFQAPVNRAHLLAQRANSTTPSCPKYWGLRSARFKYVEWDSGEDWELYDLDVDPYELNNVYGDPSYEANRVALHNWLAALKA